MTIPCDRRSRRKWWAGHSDVAHCCVTLTGVICNVKYGCLTSREIAEALFLSVRTVEGHVARILANSAATAHDAGLVAPDKLVRPTPGP